MSESREELEARIAAYIDGELPPADAARLEVFLANTDPQLAEQVIGMLADKHRLRAMPPVKAPSDLASRIMEQVERSSLLNGVEHFANPVRPWWHSRGFIAALTILVIGGFSYFLLTSVLPQDSAWKNSLAANNPSPRPAPAVLPTPAPGREVGLDKSALPEKSLSDAPIAAATPADATERPAASRLEGKFAGPVAVMPTTPAPERNAKAFMSKTESAKTDATPLVLGGKDSLANANHFGGGGGGRNDGGGFKTKSQLDAAGLVSSNVTDESVQSQLSRNRQLLSSKSADDAKLGYTKTPSAKEALDALAAAPEAEKFSPDQPIVLAFVARDSDDAAHFQTRLEQLIAGDTGALENQLTVQNRSRAQANHTNQVAANAANTNNNEIPPDANYRFYNDRDRKFVNDSPPPATNGNTYGSNGITQNSSSSLTNSAGQTQFDQRQNLAQQTLPSPAPYRVALTPDQLQTLSHEFQLRAASRGQAAYVITPTLAQSKLKSGEESSFPANGPASQPAAQTAEISQKKDTTKQADEIQQAAPAVAPSAPSSIPQESQRPPSRSPDNFVDCIITIEPEKP